MLLCHFLLYSYKWDNPILCIRHLICCNSQIGITQYYSICSFDEDSKGWEQLMKRWCRKESLLKSINRLYDTDYSNFNFFHQY